MVDSGLNWVQVSSGLSQIAQPSLILDDIGYWILDDIGWLVLQRLKFFVRFLRSVIDCATQHDIGSHLLSIPCLSRNHPNVPQIEYSYVQEKICQKKSSSFFFTSNHHSDFCLVAVFSLSRSARTSSISVYLSSCRNNFVLSIYYPVTLLCPHSPVRKI